METSAASGTRLTGHEHRYPFPPPALPTFIGCFRFSLKAQLHWVTFRTTCITTLLIKRSIAVARKEALHCKQLAKLRRRRTEDRIIRILIGWSSKALRDKLHRIAAATGVINAFGSISYMLIVQRIWTRWRFRSYRWNSCQWGADLILLSNCP